MNETVILYRARRILTVDDACPTATHVAIGDGKIVAVGGGELEQQFGPADDRFADDVMVPGFVEGHAHAMQGVIWGYPYVGYFDRIDPEGVVHPGCQTVEALVARLSELEHSLTDHDQPLFAWGYDPIYFADNPKRQDLDKVSATRPVVVFHTSLHLITVNSVALERAGLTRENIVDGVYVDEHGEPNGELAEFAAMFPVFHAVGNPLFGDMNDPDDLRRFARGCHLAGVTTTTDLYNDMAESATLTFTRITSEPDFPVRLVPAIGAMQMSIEETIERSRDLSTRGNDKLMLGSVKVITDGSIQGFSARVRQPYVNGVENGVWFEAPPKLREMIGKFHAADIKLHVHVNGDEASEFALECFEAAIAESGQRCTHVLQHAQMMDREQLERAHKLGLMVNFFANHIFYWGDQHREISVGAEIAPRMNPARTALDLGLDPALHCDAPVTPMNPLFTMWCAVNRVTASGKALGPDERITPAEALRGVTLAAAISIDLDERIGSISAGKLADISVLDDDPLSVDPQKIRDIKVRGTLLAGVWQPIP